jgi:hypothetical protein
VRSAACDRGRRGDLGRVRLEMGLAIRILGRRWSCARFLLLLSLLLVIGEDFHLILIHHFFGKLKDDE